MQRPVAAAWLLAAAAAAAVAAKQLNARESVIVHRLSFFALTHLTFSFVRRMTALVHDGSTRASLAQGEDGGRAMLGFSFLLEFHVRCAIF